jgi:hypothetical protein
MMNGTVFGSNTAAYMDHITRYNLSKQIVMNATKRERDHIKQFTDFVIKKCWRYRMNYLVKGGLATMFLYSLCKANETHNLLKLKRKITAQECCSVYNNAISSFLLFALVSVAI